MKISELKTRPDFEDNNKLNKKFIQFAKLISELKDREIPVDISEKINAEIEILNTTLNSDKAIKRQLRKSQSKILKIVESELHLVTINHYRQLGIAIGMSMGVALGTVIGSTIGNMAFIGTGIPIGLAVGIAIGTTLDKKAKEKGNQLNVEIH
jgi:ABC-type antimicrobial peptide transport system permease subunit